MPDPSPFHIGEKKIQTLLGVRDQIEPWARKVVRGHLPEQHQEFYAALPFLVAAARDSKGRPWATLLTGAPGFANSPDPKTLCIDTSPPAGDALANSMQEGSDLGLLGLEFATRRRNRLNGRVAIRTESGIQLRVGQAFGNCPQYIHERNWRRVAVAPPTALPERHSSLPPRFRELIEAADTFFIATGYRGDGENEAFGMDVSHRGGHPGFVRVDDPGSLVFPDFAGNNHYNTVGNLLMDSRVGLLFVDFAKGNLLQITGRAEIDDAAESLAGFPGAQRLIRIEIEEALEQEAAIPMRWDREATTKRPLRITAKIKESEDVTSFILEPSDDVALTGFVAGQHLPIQIEIPGHDAPIDRTYSLSNSSSDHHYRISVKRAPLGLASRHLHDVLKEGDTLMAGTPAGDFTLSTEVKRPGVLLSAGVGVTPMVSMLHELVETGASQPIWFLHGARNGSQHPLAKEVRRLDETASNVHVSVHYSRPDPGDLTTNEAQSQGRLDGDALDAELPSYDADFYLCGPSKWMASIYEHLEQRGVPLEQIHSESFGPAA